MGDNVPEPLDRTSTGRVLPKRNVGSHLIIVTRVFRKDSPKVLSIEHQQMVRALAPDRAPPQTASQFGQSFRKRHRQ